MDEHTPEVMGVLLNPVVERLNLLLVEEAQDPLLQLPASLSGNDLDETDFFLYRLVNDGPKRAIDVAAAIVDVVQIELEFHELV